MDIYTCECIYVCIMHFTIHQLATLDLTVVY